jgi:ribosomal protein S16
MGAFWTANGRDPKRNFRFRVQIEGLATAQGITVANLWYAKKAGKPNFTVTESKHSYLNHTYYWPGRVEWQTVTITFVDPVQTSPGDDVSTSTVHALSKIFEEIGYNPPNSAAEEQMKTQSKFKSVSKLGTIQVMQLDSEGTVIESWKLWNPFIKKITYGELDYENDDLTQIEVEFRYDWAELGTDETHTAKTFAQDTILEDTDVSGTA